MLRALLIITVLTKLASAVEYYLSPTGNDGQAGTSASTAWATFAKANRVLSAGDTLTLLDGVYRESWIRFGQQATTDRPITIRAANRWAAVVTLPETGYNPHSSVVSITDASHLHIDGLKIRGVADRDTTAVGAGHGISIGGSHHIQIRNCWVEHAAGGGISGTSYFWDGALGGFRVTALDHIRIEDNRVCFCCFYCTFQTSGISLFQPWSSQTGSGPDGFNIIIRRNVVWGCENRVNTSGHSYATCKAKGFTGSYTWNEFTVTDGNGIIIDDFRCSQATPGQGSPYPHHSLVENNLLVANGGRGVHVFMSDKVTVRNNTAWGNAWHLPGTWKGQLCNVFAAQNRWYNNIGIDTAETATANSRALFFAGADSLQCDFAANMLTGTVHIANTNGLGWTRAQLLAASHIVNDAGLRAPGKDPLSADFSLQADSPGRDTGDSTEGRFAADDIQTGHRPAGSGIDIGAYEYNALQSFRRIRMNNITSTIWSCDTATQRHIDLETDSTTFTGLAPGTPAVIIAEQLGNS